MFTEYTDEKGRTIIDNGLEYATIYETVQDDDGEIETITYEDKNLIVATDFTQIPADCCVQCKKHREPYGEDFLSWQGGYGWNYLLFNYKNGYCKACAEDQAARRAYKGDRSGIKSERTTETKYGTNHVIVFEDGEVFEEEKTFKGAY